MVHPAKGHHPNPSWHGPQTVLKQDTPCVHVVDSDEGRLSKANNTKNHQNKAVDFWTELLDEGNLTDRPGLSIGTCRPGISSLPL